MRIKQIETYQSPHVSNEDRARAREALKEGIRAEKRRIDQTQDFGSRGSAEGTHVMCLKEKADYRSLFSRWPGDLVDEVLRDG